MKLNDPVLDSIASTARDALLLDALRAQIAFMRAKVPYWDKRLSAAGIEESGSRPCPISLASRSFERRVPIDTAIRIAA